MQFRERMAERANGEVRREDVGEEEGRREAVRARGILEMSTRAIISRQTACRVNITAAPLREFAEGDGRRKTARKSKGKGSVPLDGYVDRELKVDRSIGVAMRGYSGR